jgi:hypothetical protein
MLLFLFIPFTVLFAALGGAVLILLAAVTLEFPLVVLGALGLGLVIHALSKLSKNREVACE